MTATNPQQFRQLTIDIPPLSGKEVEVEKIVNHQDTVFLDKTDINLDEKKALFACALHMHQPTIPAGLHGELICNLQYMFEHQGEGDNHNASVFAWCYSRMGDFIPELVSNGCSPRIMLDYSGNLLWGLQQMGREDVLDNLRKITVDSNYQPYVEWLGTMWSHGVIPSTPIPDIKLHIQAWQHHFMAIFGADALKRVKGFSPPEMHLPNHPDTLYEYVRALKECGYRWLLVQEDSVERIDGQGLHHDDKYIPNRLVAKNSRGEVISITALIKTQGSDTKLVAQMQPYHEARTKDKVSVNGMMIPPCVTQIADGENGGVMMNEFPRDFPPLWYGIKNADVVGVNGTEYLELLEASGVSEDDFPVCQAVGQHKIWQEVEDNVTPERVEGAIALLTKNDHQFHTEGASWTNDLSWVKGYENVLQPMNQLSALFHQKYDGLVKENPDITKRQDYQEALLYNLLLQTSCFRYWGQGTWTDYAQQLYQRGVEIIQ
ncbi:glycosyl hydrolase family 57 [Cyanobacterium stanieri LEGE 03274]|uniref:Glycosyl hydrolase family 57 n=1 Tax=Cyanobacterium stanieri LEGE 03274 TaxID=1828756 RepID=A0ABR9V6Y0_9CHRO|nr:glycosyl hydrolase family 57 [Cyanobacterium stanieri]MBE9222846.1 glycosyl hydrolase family 57 [Cyanobacterium stanieri LEGE 03274]